MELFNFNQIIIEFLYLTQHKTVVLMNATIVKTNTNIYTNPNKQIDRYDKVMVPIVIYAITNI